MFISPNPTAQDYKLRFLHLVLPFKIVHHASPASKKLQYHEFNGILYVRAEGLTSIVDNIEGISNTNFATPVDNNTGNSVFGIFLKGPNGVGKIKKLLKARIEENGTSFASSLSITKKGNASSGVSIDGNICLDVNGTGLDLSTESPELLLTLDLLIENEF